MSAQILGVADLGRSGERRLAEVRPIRPSGAWDPDRFARAQIRGLVRQIFSINTNRPVKQLLLSAVDPETNVSDICMRIGESLAIETLASIAVVGGGPGVAPEEESNRDSMPGWSEKNHQGELHQSGLRVRSNLWFLPSSVDDEENCTTASVRAYMSEVRREFEYSIVEAPPACGANQATAMAQLADGIILVLSARRTRRAAARKIVQTLQDSEVRLLGTVLIDREFPVPGGIYRRL